MYNSNVAEKVAADHILLGLEGRTGGQLDVEKLRVTATFAL